MATTKNSTGSSNNSSKGNFANMDDKKLRETAAKGGRASRSGSHSNNMNSDKSHR